MSMLRAKRDRLREVANNLERYGFADHGENRRDLIRMLRDVADTVWELRNLNVDVQAENDDLKSENAKLRELLTYAAQSVDCDVNGKKCPLRSECVVDGRFIGCAFEREVRELGMEVDE